MKSVADLQAEWEDMEVTLGEDAGDQRQWFTEQMTRGLQTNLSRMKPDVLQQYQFNWTMQLYEFLIKIFSQDEEQEQAIAMFRDFAAYSHLVSTYSALVQSTAKKIQRVK